ncbi:PH domain-containing protein [Rathayibacter sp. VKM Ac-2856]|uniref:PH domain-containing protein n=1 Tax=unclassified Rathayibacter TaxID=2609250 RepID=UPI001567A7A4|nr:PH domain-containing protein [Rathayibacter sp. VKM Ac-2858]NQX21152.1 PH domain-containing protein [Rathayibacter sp. VKM Ac-2856]
MHLAELPFSGGLVVALVVSGAGQTAWAGPWLRPVLLLLLAVRILHPVHAWLSTFVSIGKDGLEVRTGLVVHRVRTVVWRDVVALDVRTTWADRILGLRCVSVAAAGESTIVLPGVLRSSAEEVAERVRLAGASAQVPPSERAPASTRGRVLLRMSSGDLLLAGLAEGRLVVLTAVCAVAGVNAADELGVLPLLLSVAGEVPAVAGVVVVLLSALAAAGVVLVRFHALEVIDREGVLVIRSGLIGRREREVRTDSVIGLRLRRNPVEMMLDRVRVEVMSADSAGRSTSRVVLPSVPRVGLPAVLLESLGADVSKTVVAVCGRASLRRAAVSAAVIALPALVCLLCLLPWSFLPSRLILLAALAVIAVTASAARLRAASMAVEGGLVLRRIRLTSDQDQVVTVSALHLVTAVGVPGSAAPLLVRAHYLAGRARALTVLVPSAAVVAELGLAVRVAAPGVAAGRRRRRGDGTGR